DRRCLVLESFCRNLDRYLRHPEEDLPRRPGAACRQWFRLYRWPPVSFLWRLHALAKLRSVDHLQRHLDLQRHFPHLDQHEPHRRSAASQPLYHPNPSELSTLSHDYLRLEAQRCLVSHREFAHFADGLAI